MERHGTDLEAETREHEHDAENQPDVHLTAEHLGDAGEIGRPGEAVEQRDAIKQHARGERAEDEIFEPGFARPLVGAHEAGEHIGGEAVELEPDIERHQVARRRHDAHAERGEQDQRRIRSEEHTSELQSLMRISYAVFCLKKKTKYYQYKYKDIDQRDKLHKRITRKTT